MENFEEDEKSELHLFQCLDSLYYNFLKVSKKDDQYETKKMEIFMEELLTEIRQNCKSINDDEDTDNSIMRDSVSMQASDLNNSLIQSELDQSALDKIEYRLSPKREVNEERNEFYSTLIPHLSKKANPLQE